MKCARYFKPDARDSGRGIVAGLAIAVIGIIADRLFVRSARKDDVSRCTEIAKNQVFDLYQLGVNGHDTVLDMIR
ncbi:hypothetical protein [Pararhizobium capsulatum]|uniref:hypothetical protein n=1 Tax=Pararhizobium capsulatum TaxID=34014 RepID=UPI0027D7CEF6|nr:hypothetical protein [Pararhizobium capsulatum]